MSRPPVSVVMPFAGEDAAALAAARALRSLDVAAGDELLLVDNTGAGRVAELVGGGRPEAADPVVGGRAGVADPVGGGRPEITVLRASGERSPAHARNTGARAASGEWILFLDADCHPRPGLLEAYLQPLPGTRVGALAGEVVPAAGGTGVVSRYGRARSFLSQEAHLAHPFRPRAAAANLLVRRQAFESLGGFFEGLRAAEDTDFSWRLQQAGWRLELRREAWAEHTYRSSLPELRRQWRGYAAGRAWLARRYEGFRPQPAVMRAARAGGRRARPASPPSREPARRLDRPAFLALDLLLAVEELIGLTLSNRPPAAFSEPPAVILLAQRFPLAEDPLVELASTLEGVRVQALARPERTAQTPGVAVDYLEDHGLAERVLAAAGLAARHPLRCVLDMLARLPGDPPWWALAPGVRSLERHPAARVVSLGPARRRSPAARMARLAGRPLDEAAPSPSPPAPSRRGIRRATRR